MMSLARSALLSLVALAALAVAACGGGAENQTIIAIDGSSTVYPITEAVAEEFQTVAPGARVTAGFSGSGAGFQKFCNGETDISDASRPIRETELEACAAAGIEFVELPVAYDGITVVVHPDNHWARSMTVAELKKLWEPAAQGTIMRWSQVRPDWPDEEIHLFGPGVDSGTFDYFTDAINGEEKASRGDYNPSEDDNVLVQGVATDTHALGYFGLAYYEQNADRISAVAIDDENPDNGDGPIMPSMETVKGGTYRPLSRPLYIYIATSALARPEVEQFVNFYLQQGPALAAEVGYVPLADAEQALVADRFAARTTGSMYAGGALQSTMTLEERLRGER